MTSDFAAGNYQFIPAVFQYSGGAAAPSVPCVTATSAPTA
jgi:hypothetical protein